MEHLNLNRSHRLHPICIRTRIRIRIILVLVLGSLRYVRNIARDYDSHRFLHMRQIYQSQYSRAMAFTSER